MVGGNNVKENWLFREFWLCAGERSQEMWIKEFRNKNKMYLAVRNKMLEVKKIGMQRLAIYLPVHSSTSGKCIRKIIWRKLMETEKLSEDLSR